MLRLFAFAFAFLFLLPSARAQEPPNSTPAIQDELDSLAAAGGGVYTLPAGFYDIWCAIVVPSGVRFQGEGMGVTVLRPRYMGPCAATALTTGAIGVVGATRSAVSDLTLDKTAYNAGGNGVEIVPAGPNYSGTPSQYVDIERVEVLGRGSYHEYMIWNFRGQHVRVSDCVVDGGTDDIVTPSYQEGIESYGGHDVVFSHNTVRRVGNACIMTGAGAGIANTDIRGLVVAQNYLDTCGYGINAGSSGPLAGQDYEGAVIVDNVMTNMGEFGVLVGAGVGEVRGLRVSGNYIANVGSAARWGYGIRFVSYDAAHVSATFSENNIHGVYGFGFFVIGAHGGVKVKNNFISDVSYISLAVFNSYDLHIDGNQINSSGVHSLHVTDSGRVNVRLNDVHGWGPVSPSFIFLNTSRSVVRGNTFFNTASIPLPTIVSAGSDLIEQDNDLLNP